MCIAGEGMRKGKNEGEIYGAYEGIHTISYYS